MAWPSVHGGMTMLQFQSLAQAGYGRAQPCIQLMRGRMAVHASRIDGTPRVLL